MTRRKPAFTLVELVSVIAILTLLISILIPSLSSARRTAKAGVCLSRLKSMGNGFVIYRNENEDRFPPFRLDRLAPTDEQPYVNEFGRSQPRWQWFVQTEDAGPVINPAPFQWRLRRAGGSFSDSSVGRPTGQRGSTMSTDLYTCPSLVDEAFQNDVRDGAYGYNYQYLGNTRHDADPTRWDNFAVGGHRIRSTGRTVMVADSRGAGRRHGRHSYTLDPPRLAIEAGARRFGPSTDRYDPGDPPLIPPTGDMPAGLDPEYFAFSPAEARHNGRANVLFVDSHGEGMSHKALGYELAPDGADTIPGVPPGTPIPILDPLAGTKTATNKLWNGDGTDEIATANGTPGP